MKECKYCKKGHLVIRSGKYGEFYGCSRFPLCAGIEKIPKSNDEYLDKRTDAWLAEHK